MLHGQLNKFGVREVKNGVDMILKKLRLDSVVSLKEIERALKKSEKIKDAPLLLGIIIRCGEEKMPELAENIIALATCWKNFIPRNELDGLSPVEHEKRYPRGEYENKILFEMMHVYHERINIKSAQALKKRGGFDIDEDFPVFKKEYLSLIPSEQPFNDTGKLLSYLEIITEERKRAGYSYKEGVVVSVFGLNIFEAMENSVVYIENTYKNIMQEFKKISSKKSLRSFKGVEKIFKSLISLESFMKCTTAAPNYYAILANVALLCGSGKNAKIFAVKALRVSPGHEYAQQLIKEVNKLNLDKKNKKS